MHRIIVLAGLALALAVSAPGLQAHHALTAEFDPEKKVTLVGTVVMMEWVNPHAWLTIDVPKADDPNHVGQWQLEFGPPNALFRVGWRKKALMPGMKVTATGLLARDGRKVANARNVTLPDGTIMQAWVNEGNVPAQ